MSRAERRILKYSATIQEKANRYMCIATSARIDFAWHIKTPPYHDSGSSVRDDLPGRVLSIHLETPNEVHSLSPILYTAKNAKTVMPEKYRS